jgi:hypothetical protein
MTRALSPGGVLVFIVPQRRLAVSARYLAAHYSRFACHRFPDPEFADAGQVVLLAVKREDAVARKDEQRAIEAWAEEPLPHPPPTGTKERRVRPLMPLRRGHLAVLIPAGFLNNILLEADGHRVLVKGRTYKENIAVESDDPDVEIEREVLRTSVVTLDLHSGRFEVIEH